MFVQWLGPLMMCQWAWHDLGARGMPQVPQNFASLFDSWKGQGVTFKDIQLKVLCIALLLIIYTNADQLLDRMDRQTDRLRELYPHLSKKWMVIDSFSNSWCVVLCSVAAPGLLWSAENAKDIVLDAFGLLFLYNLDEYSSDLEYGIETSDFDDIIEERARLMDRRFILKSKRGLADEEAAEQHEGEVLWNQFLFGDVFFSIARLVNYVVGCFAMPAFTVIYWPQHSVEVGSMEVFMSVFFGHYPLPSISIVMIVATYIWRTWFWLSQHSRTYKHDVLGFMYCVILLRKEDPRLISESSSMDLQNSQEFF